MNLSNKSEKYKNLFQNVLNQDYKFHYLILLNNQ